MTINLKTIVTALAILLIALSTIIDARAQNAPPARKPMVESTIKLPEYFGLYAVKQNGEAVVIDKPVEQPNDTPAVTLPEDVEFLIYGKDEDTSDIHLIAMPSAELLKRTQADYQADLLAIATGFPKGSSEGKLLVKPVGNQSQMLRLIPASTLSNGVYQIGTPLKKWYRFVVGSMPAQSRVPDRPITVEQASKTAIDGLQAIMKIQASREVR